MTNLIVKSAVKEQINQNVASEFYDELEGEVEQVLADAAQRATDNDRKTVQPRDL
jgi:histone H3/H4